MQKLMVTPIVLSLDLLKNLDKRFSYTSEKVDFVGANEKKASSHFPEELEESEVTHEVYFGENIKRVKTFFQNK